MGGQPLVYPAPISDRSSFIDACQPRSPSLDEFSEQRQALSCPASGVSESSSGCYSPGELLKKTAAYLDVRGRADEAASECSTADTAESMELRRNHTVARAIPLKLADAVNPPAAVPNTLVPSIGSVGHSAGTCKPCAFFHTKGCDKGAECSFCHACGPEARLARKKEKRAYFSTMKTVRKLLEAGVGLHVPPHAVDGQLGSSGTETIAP